MGWDSRSFPEDLSGVLQEEGEFIKERGAGRGGFSDKWINMCRGGCGIDIDAGCSGEERDYIRGQ